MPPLSTTDARSEIVEILSDSIAVALDLQESLATERDALSLQDIDMIDAAVDYKSSCIEKLTRLDRKREKLLATCGFTSDPNAMQEAITWCDSNELIKGRWERLLAVAAEGSNMNKTNGAIIRARQQQFDASLAVLRGATPGSETYGRNGEETNDYGRRSMGRA